MPTMGTPVEVPQPKMVATKADFVFFVRAFAMGNHCNFGFDRRKEKFPDRICSFEVLEI